MKKKAEFFLYVKMSLYRSEKGGFFHILIFPKNFDFRVHAKGQCIIVEKSKCPNSKAARAQL